MPAVANVFGVAKAPALVAIKTGKRSRYAVHKGEVNAATARDWLDAVLGRANQLSFTRMGDELEEAFDE